MSKKEKKGNKKINRMSLPELLKKLDSMTEHEQSQYYIEMKSRAAYLKDEYIKREAATTSS